VLLPQLNYGRSDDQAVRADKSKPSTNCHETTTTVNRVEDFDPKSHLVALADCGGVVATREQKH